MCLRIGYVTSFESDGQKMSLIQRYSTRVNITKLLGRCRSLRPESENQGITTNIEIKGRPSSWEVICYEYTFNLVHTY